MWFRLSFWNAERIKFLSKMGNLEVFELSSFSFKGFPYLIIYLIHKVFGLGYFFFSFAGNLCGDVIQCVVWWRFGQAKDDTTPKEEAKV